MSKLNLSEQYLVTGRLGGGDCLGGGWEDQALDKIKDIGISDEACFPYHSGGCSKTFYNYSENAKCPDLPRVTCTFEPDHNRTKVTYCNPSCYDSFSYYCAMPYDFATLCQDSANRIWTVNTVTKVNNDSASIKKALVCNGPLAIGSNKWGHAIVLVGWNDSMTFPDWNTTGGWIHKNSWGLGYGLDGFGHLPYDHPYTDFVNHVDYPKGVGKK